MTGLLGRIAHVVPLAALAALSGALLGSTAGGGPGTPVMSATVMGTTALAFVVPITATAGAFSGMWLRLLTRSMRASARGRVGLMARVALIQMLAGLAGVLTGIAVVMSRAGWSLPAWQPLITSAAALLGASLVGQLLGRWLTVGIAAPLTLAGGYFLIAFPPAMQPVWLRHMVAVIDCCDESTTLNPRVLAAIVLFWLGTGLGALVASTRWRPTAVRVLAGLVMGAVSIAGSASLVSPLGWSPAIPRSDPVVCSADGGSVEICLWDEHESQRAAVTELIAQMSALAASHDIPMPDTLTESLPPDSTLGDGTFNLGSPGDQQALTLAVVIGVLPVPDRCERDGSLDAAYVNAWQLLGTWWFDQLDQPRQQAFTPIYAHDYLAVDQHRVATLTAALAACDRDAMP